jgi:hypothetical protein
MPKLPYPFRLDRATAGFAIVLAGLFAACQNDTGPGPVPSNIEIVSGDGQYSKQGTELEDPIVAQVTLSDGSVGAGVAVRFVVKSGGGTVSRSQAAADSYGRASVRWTLGPTLGTQELTIESVDNGQVETVAQATSATFHCPEEDPTFARRFFPAHLGLMLFTRASSVLASAGAPRVGVVQLGLDTGNLEFDATPLTGFDETVFHTAVRDCAFSENGEFYLAWNSPSAAREIVKFAPDHSVSHFATLEGILGTEITMLEGGVLAGCDEFGPFTVGCRDTLTRYPDAIFSGTAPDIANYDAVAYDPTGNYLYFIDEPARRLRRIPLDGYTQTGPVEEIVTLTADEAVGATGMVVHTDGSVFMVVESAGTKSIVKVSAGTKTTAFDFFSRGAGNAAGIQDDLAIDAANGFLYTLDTLNNVVLIYVIGSGQFEELAPDNATDPNAASNTSSGERVGLAILP